MTAKFRNYIMQRRKRVEIALLRLLRIEAVETVSLPCQESRCTSKALPKNVSDLIKNVSEVIRLTNSSRTTNYNSQTQKSDMFTCDSAEDGGDLTKFYVELGLISMRRKQLRSFLRCSSWVEILSSKLDLTPYRTCGIPK